MTARVVILAFVVYGWLVNVCHEHLGWCPDCYLAHARNAFPTWCWSTRVVARDVTSCVGLGVVADSQGCRAGGCCFNCCHGDCRRRCSGAVREAEGAPMVDVDMVRTESQVDAGAQIGEGRSKGRKMSHEAEGPMQIGVCSSRGVDEC